MAAVEAGVGAAIKEGAHRLRNRPSQDHVVLTTWRNSLKRSARALFAVADGFAGTAISEDERAEQLAVAVGQVEDYLGLCGEALRAEVRGSRRSAEVLIATENEALGARGLLDLLGRREPKLDDLLYQLRGQAAYLEAAAVHYVQHLGRWWIARLFTPGGRLLGFRSGEAAIAYIGGEATELLRANMRQISPGGPEAHSSPEELEFGPGAEERTLIERAPDAVPSAIDLTVPSAIDLTQKLVLALDEDRARPSAETMEHLTMLITEARRLDVDFDPTGFGEPSRLPDEILRLADETMRTIRPLLPGPGFYLASKEGLWQLTGNGEVLIGRNNDRSDIWIQHSTVSGLHASIKPIGGQWTVTDLNSTNRVYVGYERIEPDDPKVLLDGDLVWIGSVPLLYAVIGLGDRTPFIGPPLPRVRGY